MMTIAPELEGAPEVIAEAARRGVCVSLGHSDADFAAAERGIAAGARHATHTFNAMRPLDHRSPGILGAVLTDRPRERGHHCRRRASRSVIVKLVAAPKARSKPCSSPMLFRQPACPMAATILGRFEVDVRDGKCMADGKLAGSVLTMDRAVRNLAQFRGMGSGRRWRPPAKIRRAWRIANKGVLRRGSRRGLRRPQRGRRSVANFYRRRGMLGSWFSGQSPGS
jgi:N-acetylglucosamine-6-phosphate deacetylase